MERISYYLSRLEKKGVKPTAIRLLVFRTMLEMGRSVSLTELGEQLETVDKSTVFRTLNLFLAHRLVHAIADGDGVLKYEVCANENSCSLDDMHVHFYCVNCHRTFCFKAIHIPLIELPAGFRMDSVNYMVKGLCSDCVTNR